MTRWYILRNQEIQMLRRADGVVFMNSNLKLKSILLWIFFFLVQIFGVPWAHAEWTSVSPPAVSSNWELFDVRGSWAVGQDFTNQQGVLLQFSNGSWTPLQVPSVSSDWGLASIDFGSATDGWAVGRDNANSSAALLHYESGTWTSVEPPAGISSDWGLSAVDSISSTGGWMAGQDFANKRGVLLHYEIVQVKPPVVSTTAVTDITTTGATSGGNITSDGGAPVTARGVCWDTAVNPVVGGNCTDDGTGTGTFTSTIAGLLPSTRYHVRAYATNAVGTGYGSDGTLWGGEFLLADCRDFTRVGHCQYLPLPGGAKAIKEPWRITAWVLYNLYGKEFVEFDMECTSNLPEGWQLLLDAASKGINAPLTSSAGRLFDVAAGILGLRNTIHYEGQAAIELELAVQGEQGQVFPYNLYEDSGYVLDFMPTFAALTEAVKQGRNVHFLSACFHVTIAQATVEMVCRIRQDTGITKVALSGGVWQNRTLLKKVVGMLQQDGFTVYNNQRVPPNDGGLALGQGVVAGVRIMER